MNVAFIIPTGIGCVIGGHAGDATPAAKLIAQTCDKLILHPNVVNASDINEMPANALYVEGSILDRFLEGKIELQEVPSNRVLVAVSPPVKPETINAVNAAKSTIGMDVKIVELNEPLIMKGWFRNKVATGKASGVEALIKQVIDMDFDALAVASPIQVTNDIALRYFQNFGPMVNPWGGIEAIVSRQIANALNKPVAHAPIESDSTKDNDKLYNILCTTVVDLRKAAEVCSSCYIHCILKGLFKAPRIGKGINRSTISCLITPTGCVGRPHIACFNAGILVIAVEENKAAAYTTTGRQWRTRDKWRNKIIYVANYLEAAGYINCLNAGITPRSVRA